jgi:3-dehydroquinate dehydratase/shikimate dehydrogenase
VTILTTDRLILRPWRESDLDPFAAMNADPDVMRFFPRTLDREASDAMAHRISLMLDEQGWGLWATEVPGVAPFIGFIGLAPVPFDSHFTPAIEVGWRLGKAYWGRGYAPEGARAALAYAFDTLELDEVISMTIPANEPSQRVMQKLGLRHDPSDDFDHPNHSDREDHRHVLYRIRRPDYLTGNSVGRV